MVRVATADQIGKVRDPERRAVEAVAFMRRGQVAIREVRAMRDDAIAELRVAGWSQRRIAKLLGLTPAAVNKIDRVQGLVSEQRTVKR